MEYELLRNARMEYLFPEHQNEELVLEKIVNGLDTIVTYAVAGTLLVSVFTGLGIVCTVSKKAREKIMELTSDEYFEGANYSLKKLR